MPMRFVRGWDFNQGNKPITKNDLSQDQDVIDALVAVATPPPTPPETLLLEAGQTAADVPAGTPVGTLIFIKA